MPIALVKMIVIVFRMEMVVISNWEEGEYAALHGWT
jgi:hypothetical protein